MKKIRVLQPGIAAILLLCAVFCQGQVLKERNLYSTPTDTAYRYYVDKDSFLIQYKYGSGYMSPSVGRRICDVDSTVSDSARAANPFTGMKNCREDTAFYNADRHYFARIQVYAILNGKRKPIGKEQYGYYVPHECFEDVPEYWVATAKKQSVSK